MTFPVVKTQRLSRTGARSEMSSHIPLPQTSSHVADHPFDVVATAHDMVGYLPPRSSLLLGKVYNADHSKFCSLRRSPFPIVPRPQVGLKCLSRCQQSWQSHLQTRFDFFSSGKLLIGNSPHGTTVVRKGRGRQEAPGRIRSLQLTGTVRHVAPSADIYHSHLTRACCRAGLTELLAWWIKLQDGQFRSHGHPVSCGQALHSKSYF